MQHEREKTYYSVNLNTGRIGKVLFPSGVQCADFVVSHHKVTGFFEVEKNRFGASTGAHYFSLVDMLTCERAKREYEDNKDI